MNALQTDDGLLAWDVIEGCRFQMRMSHAGPYGLDFGSILAMARAKGAPEALLADVLPEIELAAMSAIRRSADEGE